MAPKSKGNTELKTIQTVQIKDEEIDLSFDEKYLNAVKSKCQECDYPLPPMFMLDTELWKEAGCKGKDFLCMTCFTKKLGRKLTIYDLLLDIPVNNDLLQILANFEV